MVSKGQRIIPFLNKLHLQKLEMKVMLPKVRMAVRTMTMMKCGGKLTEAQTRMNNETKVRGGN